MLKHILTTSALIVIGAVSIQSAAAADAAKLRQIVVQPAGTVAGTLATKKANFILAPQAGIPSPSADPVVTADKGNKIPFILTPQAGIPSPSTDPVVTADKGNAPQIKVLPRIVRPEGIPSADADAGAFEDPITSADAAPVQIPAPIAPPVDATPAGADLAANTADDAAAEAATPSEPVLPGIHNPRDLYAMLSDRGYAVKIIRRDQNQNYVFLVTNPHQDEDGLLLLVDGHYGKILVRKPIDLADYGYASHTQSYPAASYPAASYANDRDNCDTGYAPYGRTVARY